MLILTKFGWRYTCCNLPQTLNRRNVIWMTWWTFSHRNRDVLTGQHQNLDGNVLACDCVYWCCYCCWFVAPTTSRLLSEKMEEMRLDVFRDIGIGPSQYRFDIWDFGGQQAYYTAHQTFLSHRAIYLLTVDMSKHLDEELSTEVEPPKWKETGSPKSRKGTSWAAFTTIMSVFFTLVAL